MTGRINEGLDVWAEAVRAGYRTTGVYNEYARIRELELDVYFRWVSRKEAPMIYVPPTSRVMRIACEIHVGRVDRCSQIDVAIAAKQGIISDLKAYKQSLIYEVVAGKREVWQ